MDVLQGRAVRLGQDKVLQALDPFRILVKDRKEFIDDIVEQHVEEKADVIGPHMGSGRLDAAPHGLENILLTFLESQQGSSAEKEAHLLGDKAILGDGYGPSNYEQTPGIFSRRRVIVDLGALISRKDILDGEGMKRILLGEGVDHVHVA